MKPTLHLVEFSQLSILQQLQWEEALLRADTRNWCLINRGSHAALILGISGVITQHINQEKMRHSPLPLIRRFSGGGSVVVDEDTLFVTFICQAADVAISPFPRPLLEWSAGVYRPLFLQDAFQLRENDYVIGEKKWGGNAQSITKGRWLHHSSLLWDFHPDKMDYLLFPPKVPNYRLGRSHQDFLCCLKDYYPHYDHFRNSLLDQINHQFHVVKSDQRELEAVAIMPHRKMTCVL